MFGRVFVEEKKIEPLRYRHLEFVRHNIPKILKIVITLFYNWTITTKNSTPMSAESFKNNDIDRFVIKFNTSRNFKVQLNIPSFCAI